MQKKILIMLIALIAAIITVQASDVYLPIIEHECYSKFADKTHNYSFIKGAESKIENFTITIAKFEEMCKYSEKPTKCYECIALKKYGIEKTEENTRFTLKNILFIITIILALILIYISIRKNGKK